MDIDLEADSKVLIFLQQVKLELGQKPSEPVSFIQERRLASIQPPNSTVNQSSQLIQILIFSPISKDLFSVSLYSS
jgi:hypothetical protein